MMLHPRLRTLFTNFELAGVHWCLLRLPQSFNRKGGDIDLLIAEEDTQSVLKILAAQQFTRLPAWKPALHFLSFDRVSGQWLWLHIVTQLAFGPYELLKTGCEKDCLKRRRRNPQEASVFSLANADAFWELLLHCLINKGQIAEKYRVRLQELAKAGCTSSPLTTVIETACPAGWNAEGIARLAAEGNWNQLEAVSPLLTSTWIRRARISLMQILSAKITRSSSQFLNKPNSRGITVAFLGPDGAGKSTLISGLQEAFILPMIPLYMGLTGGLLPYANRLWLPFLVIPARLLIFWARYLRGKYYQFSGWLVIYDRYIYDWAVPTPFPLNRMQRIYRWIDGHCLPGPDKVFILDAPGKVMFNRKGEYTPEMLEDWRHHFLALHDHLPQSKIIDTTLPPQQVLAEVTDHIWEVFSERWTGE